MDPLEQRLELERAVLSDDDLAVEHAPLGQLLAKRRRELRKVPLQRLEIAALDLHVVPVAKDERTKTVPFRLEDEVRAFRDLVHELREHRRNRGLERQLHTRDSNLVRLE